MGALAGKVAVVTGASRGIGRGIALALAEEGATVYVTGRTTAPGGKLPGTIGDTARQVDVRGGRGVAVAMDHGDNAQVAALFAQIGRDEGRLDILVNNAIAIPEWLTEFSGARDRGTGEGCPGGGLGASRASVLRTTPPAFLLHLSPR